MLTKIPKALAIARGELDEWAALAVEPVGDFIVVNADDPRVLELRKRHWGNGDNQPKPKPAAKPVNPEQQKRQQEREALVKELQQVEIPIEALTEEERIGLGDLLASGIKSVRGDVLAKWYTSFTGLPCGCDARKEWLNRMLSWKRGDPMEAVKGIVAGFVAKIASRKTKAASLHTAKSSP